MYRWIKMSDLPTKEQLLKDPIRESLYFLRVKNIHRLVLDLQKNRFSWCGL